MTRAVSGPVQLTTDRLPTSRRVRTLVIALSILVFLVAVAGRVLGPSDLEQNFDQSKTISFTVDMVENGNWILPRDMRGDLSRKPPLVNWIGAPFAASGLFDEWAFKMPSLLAALVTFLAIAWIGRRLLTAIAGDNAAALGWCAAAAWCATPDSVKHLYFLRPDMTLIACSTVAWAASVVSLQQAEDGLSRWKSNAVFWLFVGLAGLAKGPFAFFLVIMVPLTSLAWFGSLRQARGAGWWWGIPLACAVFSVWFVPALIADRDYVLGVLIGLEVIARTGVASMPFGARLLAVPRVVGFFFERFAPFSLAAVAALFVWRMRGLRDLGVMPAAVMPVCVVAILAVLGLASGSFPASSYPAAAILSAAFLYWWWGRKEPSYGLVGVAAAALISVTVITVVSWNFDRGALSGKGDAVNSFARQARGIVGSDPVVFGDLGYTAVPSLMGRHQAGKASAEQQAAAVYAVMKLDAVDATPILDARSLDGRWGIGLFRADEVRDVLARETW